MSTSSQKRRNHRVENDDTSSFSGDSGGMLLQTAQDVISSDSEVAERVSRCTAPVVALRAAEESATHEVFKRYPSKLTINYLKLCASTYRLPCGTRLMVPSPGDHVAFPLTGFVSVSPNT